MRHAAHRKPKVVIYMPFYSGACEPRHARMHDIIHYLNRQDYLQFDYFVLAEKGKQKDSRKVSYTVLPFFREYTESYLALAKKKPTGAKEKPGRSREIGVGIFSGVAKWVGEQVSRVQVLLEKGKAPAVTLGTVAGAKVRELFLSTEKVVLPTGIKVSRRPVQRVQAGVRRLARYALTLASSTKSSLLNSLRWTRKAGWFVARPVVRPVKRWSRLMRNKEVLVWRLCRVHLFVRAHFVLGVDVLHVVRPNATSEALVAIFRKRNPNLRVIVGPNIMSYMSLEAEYDRDYFAGSEVDRVLAVGSYHERLLKEFGVPEDKLLRLPPSVDPAYFNPGVHEVSGRLGGNGTMTVLFVASQLAVEKGTETFLRALHVLKDSGAVPFRAIIAGDRKVNRKVQTPFDRTLLNGLEGFVDVRNKVARSAIGRLFGEADVYVHAGQAEAGPTTTIEALSCGTPCILPDHECFKEPELLESCQFFPYGDADALAVEISRYYQHWLRNEAREGTFLPRVSHDETIDFLQDLYGEMGFESRVQAKAV
jgi:glycosyltransferase involved in cell wall biosynthesis